MTREKEIERYLVNKVKKAGGVAYKWVSPGNRGVPDRIILLNDRVLFAELKAPGKKPSALQRRIHDRMLSLGARVWVIDSKEQVDEFIRIFAN